MKSTPYLTLTAAAILAAWFIYLNREIPEQPQYDNYSLRFMFYSGACAVQAKADMDSCLVDALLNCPEMGNEMEHREQLKK